MHPHQGEASVQLERDQDADDLVAGLVVEDELSVATDLEKFYRF